MTLGDLFDGFVWRKTRHHVERALEVPGERAQHDWLVVHDHDDAWLEFILDRLRRYHRNGSPLAKRKTFGFIGKSLFEPPMERSVPTGAAPLKNLALGHQIGGASLLYYGVYGVAVRRKMK
jgi:hypothetical protein